MNFKYETEQKTVTVTANVNGECIGFVSVILGDEKNDHAGIFKAGVEPEHQRRGIYSELINQMIEVLDKKLNLKGVYSLSRSADSLAFWIDALNKGKATYEGDENYFGTFYMSR